MDRQLTHTGTRPSVELLEILFKEATDRGFGNYGICDFIARLINRDIIGMCEGIKLEAFIAINRPKDIPHNQSYYWPTGPLYTGTRLNFIKRILDAFKNNKPRTVDELRELVTQKL